MSATGFPFVTGEMPTATQWNNLFAQYVLATNGVLNSPTINTPTISTIISPTPIQFVIAGATIPFPGPTGPYLPIGGGTMAGTIGQVLNTTWTGGWPTTAPIGIQLTQTFLGTPSSGYNDPQGGTGLPVNFINVSETMNFDFPASYVNALGIRHQFGGAGATGGRVALLVDLQNVGPVSTANNNDFYSCCQFSNYASYNITGSTALAPRGNFYAWNAYTSAKARALDGSPIYIAGLAGCEIDYTVETGASVFGGVGILIANLSPAGATETNNGTGLVIASSHDNTAGNVGFKSNAIHFGNQDSTHSLPIQSTGSLIGSGPGTVLHGIDFSATTIAGYLIKGPNSGGIDGNNFVHTDRVQSASTNAIGFTDASGNALFDVARSGASPVNYIATTATGTGNAAVIEAVSGTDANVYLQLRGGGTSGATAGVTITNGLTNTIASFNGVASQLSGLNVTGAASANNVLVDVAGTATGLAIAASSASSLILGNAGITTQILGTLKGAAGTFTANGSVATALSSVGPAGSHTTVQEWLTITDTAGNVRYIPCF